MNTFDVRFKIKDHTWGIFFKLSMCIGKSRQVRLNMHQWDLLSLLDPADTFYRELLQSSIYSPFPIFQTSLDTCIADHLGLMASHPSSNTKTPREPPVSAHGSLITHACTGTTEWLCSSTGGGGDTPQTPHPVSPFPQTEQQDV